MIKKYYKKILLLVISIFLLSFSFSNLKFKKANIFAKQNISNKILIYNTDPDEVYLDNKNIKDLSKKLTNLLKIKKLDSNLINVNSGIDISKKFENSRNSIEKIATLNKNLILLDIHSSSQDNYPVLNRRITIILAGNSPNFKSNKSFTNLLEKKLETSAINHNVNYDIKIVKNALGYFNQDLSNRAILIQIGTKFSSEKDRTDCIYALSDALKNYMN